MKKSIAAVFFMICVLSAFANEKQTSIGIAPEFNMDSRHNFAGGIALSFNHRLKDDVAVGLSITASTNFYAIRVLEPAFIFRRYMPENNYTGFFVQGELGAFIIFEEGDITPLFNVGIGGGYRFPLGSIFYIEPYARFGYPFAYAIGVSTGICF